MVRKIKEKKESTKKSIKEMLKEKNQQIENLKNALIQIENQKILLQNQLHQTLGAKKQLEEIEKNGN